MARRGRLAVHDALERLNTIHHARIHLGHKTIERTSTPMPEQQAFLTSLHAPNAHQATSA